MILLLWKGKGWTVAATVFLSSLAAEILTQFITNDDQYYQEHAMPLAHALCAASAVIYWIVQYLKGKQHTLNSPLDYVEKPPSPYQPGDHSLFLLPMEYWVWVLILGAVYVCFARSSMLV